MYSICLSGILAGFGPFYSGTAQVASKRSCIPKRGRSDRAVDFIEKTHLSPNTRISQEKKRHTISTDSSDCQLRRVLLQKQDENVDKPTKYWSKILYNLEPSLGTTRRECLTVVWATVFLRLYLEDAKFTIQTDHHALKWSLNLAGATDKLVRWWLRPTEYNFEIVHRADVRHQEGDALS